MTLDVYEGDLGIDDGTPRSVYTLDTDRHDPAHRARRSTSTRSSSRRARPPTCPNGLGTITFENESPAGAEGTRSP